LEDLQATYCRPLALAPVVLTHGVSTKTNGLPRLGIDFFFPKLQHPM
jgi:hypothetical protein